MHTVLKIAFVLVAAAYIVHSYDGGHSSTYRKQEGKHYSFGYHIKDKKGKSEPWYLNNIK